MPKIGCDGLMTIQENMSRQLAIVDMGGYAHLLSCEPGRMQHDETGSNT